MRYFFFSYMYIKRNGNSGFGNLSFEYKDFPTIRYIREIIMKEDRNVFDLSIISHFEFKSKEDFDKFETE